MTLLPCRVLAPCVVLVVLAASACRPDRPVPTDPDPGPPPRAALGTSTETGHDGTPLVPVTAGLAAFGGAIPHNEEDALPEQTLALEAFLLDAHPVTAGQLTACIAAGECPALPEPDDYARNACTPFDRLHPDRPANCVTREDAAAYCSAVGRRLPTEQEWEAAARLVHGAQVVSPWPPESRAPEAPEALAPEALEALAPDVPEDALSDEEASDSPGHLRNMPMPADVNEDADAVLPIRGLLDGVSEWTAGVFDGASNERVGLVDGRPRAPVRGLSLSDVESERTVMHRFGEGPHRRSRTVGFRCAVSADSLNAARCSSPSCAWEANPLPEVEVSAALAEVPAGVVNVLLPRLLPRESEPEEMAVDAFRIRAVPVSAIEYERCLAAGVCPRPRRDRFSVACTLGRAGVEAHPMNCLDAGDAEAYCRSQGARLPTEVEWLRAVFGDGVHPMPWGAGEGGPANRMSGDEGTEDPDGWVFTSPVGAMEGDRSLFGVLDGGGNVSEWVAEPVDQLAVPPGRAGDADLRRRLRAITGGGDDESAPTHRVIGASWADSPNTDGRSYALLVRRDSVGFRCAWDGQ